MILLKSRKIKDEKQTSVPCRPGRNIFNAFLCAFLNEVVGGWTSSSFAGGVMAVRLGSCSQPHPNHRPTAVAYK